MDMAPACGVDAASRSNDAASSAGRAGHRTITVTGNPHALAFYLACGFVVIGHAETALGSGPLLRLDLTDQHRP
jgi:hypothetical protein